MDVSRAVADSLVDFTLQPAIAPSDAVVAWARANARTARASAAASAAVPRAGGPGIPAGPVGVTPPASRGPGLVTSSAGVGTAAPAPRGVFSAGSSGSDDAIPPLIDMESLPPPSRDRHPVARAPHGARSTGSSRDAPPPLVSLDASEFASIATASARRIAAKTISSVPASQAAPLASQAAPLASRGPAVRAAPAAPEKREFTAQPMPADVQRFLSEVRGSTHFLLTPG